MGPVVIMHNTVQYAQTEHYNYWLAALKKLKWGKESERENQRNQRVQTVELFRLLKCLAYRKMGFTSKNTNHKHVSYMYFL